MAHVKKKGTYKKAGIRLMTVKEVAQGLRVTPLAVYKWLERKQLRGSKLAGRWKIDMDDLTEFVMLNYNFPKEEEPRKVLKPRGKPSLKSKRKLSSKIKNLIVENKHGRKNLKKSMREPTPSHHRKRIDPDTESKEFKVL